MEHMQVTEAADRSKEGGTRAEEVIRSIMDNQEKKL